jgi:proteasome lid subunit RPN8/RPN11
MNSNPSASTVQMRDTSQTIQPKGQSHPRPIRRREMGLIFSPLAWLKLQFFLHAGDTEIGGFGISKEEDLLYVEDFVTVRQTVSSVSVEFADSAVADYFDQCVDKGLAPARFARIWCHTHPGISPNPSSVDEHTFQRVFGTCDWSVMFIIARGGSTYARLAFNAGPTGALLLPVEVDWEAWPQVVSDQYQELAELAEAWMDEYGQNIFPEPLIAPVRRESDRPVLADRHLLSDQQLLTDRFGEEDFYDLLEQQEREDRALASYEQAWGWQEAGR